MLLHNRVNNVIKGATIKGRIFFPLKVATLRIEHNFKGQYIEKLPKLLYANMSVF